MRAGRYAVDFFRRMSGQASVVALLDDARANLGILRTQVEYLSRQVDGMVLPTGGQASQSGERLKNLGRYLTPRKALNVGKRRFGRRHDGGYVMLDDLGGQAVALSFGVNDDASWDADAAAEGLVVHQYDHTIPGPPIVDPRIIFHRSKILASKGEDGTTLQQILEELQVTAPASAVLKIDIEGDEWPVFDAASEATLACFSQIVCEFHNFGEVFDGQTYATYERVLSKLNDQFQSVHVHANNHGQMLMVGGVPFPDVLEVTFANRTRYRFTETTESFPTELDQPNKAGFADYYLGRFDFP